MGKSCVTATSYVTRVPSNALNGTTGRRWLAIADEREVGFFRNKRNALAAVKKALTAKEKRHG